MCGCGVAINIISFSLSINLLTALLISWLIVVSVEILKTENADDNFAKLNVA